MSKRAAEETDRVQTLSLDDFVRLFGTSRVDMPKDCVQLIRKGDFRYRKLQGSEREAVTLSVLKRVFSGNLSVAGDQGAKARWEKGWSENLKELSRTNFDFRALAPKYIRPNQAVRLNQDYVMPADGAFELNWYRVFTTWLFRKYLSDVDTIYEFGCGSGINVAALAQLFPDKKIVGLDWAAASKKIVDRLAKVHGLNVAGRIFNFFKPDQTLKFSQNSAVLTIGALEQTGQNYEPFLRFLLRQSPAICVHSEPICEWYDENNLVDYMAVLFHKKRGYWMGFPSRLKRLESQGRVEILKEKRSYFGSLFIEGYSQTIWRPTKR